jgi:hypothetical protein
VNFVAGGWDQASIANAAKRADDLSDQTYLERRAVSFVSASCIAFAIWGGRLS